MTTPKKPMLVRDWMAHPVVAIKPLDTIAHAREVMERHRVNQLPVIVKDQLVGIVTDRDLRDAFPSIGAEVDEGQRGGHDPRPDRVPVEAVMSSTVLTIGAAEPVSLAASIMRRERIGALPVVEKDRVVGIITRSDVLGAFAHVDAVPGHAD